MNGRLLPKDEWEPWWTSVLQEIYVFGNSYRNWHRTDGPAITYANGDILWVLNGIRYYDIEEFQRDAKLTDEEVSILILKYGEFK